MDSVMGDEDAFSSASTSPDQPMRPFSQASSDALASAVNKEVDELIAMASQSLPTTPPSSPLNEAKKKDGGARPSIFSLALVSKQLGNFWTSAKERMFGEDYWIPADPNEIAVFPADLFAAHPRMLPSKSDKEVIFSVCQGSVKNQPNMSLYHVTFAFTNEEGQTQTLSIFRSNDIQEAIDLYQSCHACQDLFLLLDCKKDMRKAITGLLAKLKLHPLWQAVHVAAEMGTIAFFEQKHKEGTLERILDTVCHPEGLYPLMVAIARNQVGLVGQMLKMGAVPSRTDIRGNNAMHYAALASAQMLEVMWQHESTHPLINTINNDGCTPLFVAIRNANPRCTTALLRFGAELNIRCRGKSPLFEAMQSKGKSIEVIKALLEASPSMLTERDAPTGNTVLHSAAFKQPIMALLMLKGKEVDINAKNNAGQTPLIVCAHREDLGCIMTLSAHNADLDAQDNNGNTALHILVSKSNIMLSRTLLCLGANPNVKNHHGDTARHLAAKLRSKERAELVRSLVICGAERCEADKVSCRSGCANKQTLGLIHSSSMQSQLGSPAGVDLTTSRSGTATPVTDDEFDTDSMYGKEPAIKDAPPHEFLQNMCFDKMRKTLKTRKESAHPHNNMLNLLSMDGGGIRGLVIIQLLLAVEDIMKERVFDYFDWVAGTSTGALVAAALAQGKSLRECQQIYLRFKDHIFEGWARPYNTIVLEQFIRNEMGESSTMADLEWPRLMMTTVKADIFPVKLEFFRNYRLPLSEEDNEKLGYNVPEDLKLWKALRCSSAAPTFFSSVDGKYIDGGIIANNPALDLLSEVHLWNATMQYMGRPHSDEVGIGCMLSVGTGVIPPSPIDSIDFDLSGNPYSTAVAMKNLGVILIDQVTATEGAPVARSRSWCHNIGVPFFRLSAPMSKHIGIDVKEDKEIAQLMWDCVEYSFQHRKEMSELIELLRLSGPSRDRRHFFTRANSGTRDLQTQTCVDDFTFEAPNGFPDADADADAPTPIVEDKGLFGSLSSRFLPP